MIRIFCVVAIPGLLLAACAHTPSTPSTRSLGAPAALGGGTVASYADIDAAGSVQAIGVLFSGTALDDLPTTPSDGHHCFDANKDGSIDPDHECVGGHETVLPLPSDAARRPDLPFKWAMLNWNPHGHIPPGIYDKPHFDVHFYLDPIEKVFAIESGPCGPERVRCDQFTRARLPVPANYMPADFKDVEAVVPAMGNHLVDVTAPEFRGVPFTRTWIYGVNEGRVTFYEEMVTAAYMKSQPDICFPIKTAAAVAVGGRYPTKSCIRYAKDKAEYTVSLEGFELRPASPPSR